MKPPSAARAAAGSARAMPLEAITRKGRSAFFFMCSLLLLFDFLLLGFLLLSFFVSEKYRRHRTTGQAMFLRRYSEKTSINPLLPQTIRRHRLPRHLANIAQQLPTYLLSFPAKHNITPGYVCANRTLYACRKSPRETIDKSWRQPNSFPDMLNNQPEINIRHMPGTTTYIVGRSGEVAGGALTHHPLLCIRRQDPPGATIRTRGH
ncbi:hypothetical protein D3C78_937070 [compost metagenome]